MHSKGNNIEIMINDGVDEVMKDLFKSFKKLRIVWNRWTVVRFSSIIFTYCITNVTKKIRIVVNHRFSWLDKKQKSNNNHISKKDNKCFQYAVTVALNH